MKRAILIGIIAVVAFSFSGCSYNELTAKQQNVKGKWANVGLDANYAIADACAEALHKL